MVDNNDKQLAVDFDMHLKRVMNTLSKEVTLEGTSES